MHRLLGISVLVFFSIFLSLSCDDKSNSAAPLLALGSDSGSVAQELSSDEAKVIAEETLATIMSAISRIPWADLHNQFCPDKSSVSGGSSSSSGPLASISTGYTITFYEEAGLKVDVGIADDWSGLILNVYLTNFQPSSSLPIGVSGSLNIFTTFTDWTEVKLVMNTLPNAKLSISGIPLIKPTVALTDVTIYFDWYNLAIVEKTGNMGKINLMGYSFAFDPSWITTIMDLLKGILPSLS